MRKRVLAMVLALVMCLGLAGTALAAEQTVVYVSTAEELKKVISDSESNIKIVLEEKEYALEREFIRLQSVENVTIQGTGKTRITVSSGDAVIIAMEQCKNITLEGLVLGHDIPIEEGCSAAVVYLQNSSGIEIINCDIFGCGLCGINSYRSDFTVTNSTIRDCSSNIADIGKSSIGNFEGCNFTGNGYLYPNAAALWLDEDSQLSFSNCVFQDNGNKVFKRDRLKDTSGPCKLNNCTFYNNGWDGDNVTAPPDSAEKPVSTPSDPVAVSAAPTSAPVLVNGEKTAFDAYEINGNNYFKLRDLAYVLSGTDKQFEIAWDGEADAISLTSGEAYTAVGGEMSSKGAGKQNAVPTTSKILLDGKEVSFTAYEIGGNNYFKLRDVGNAFDFGVDWDDAAGAIKIDTSKGYSAD